MTAYLLSYYCSVRFSFSTTVFMDKVGRKGRNPALDLINFFKTLPYTDFVIFGAGFLPFLPFPSYPFRIYPIFSSYPKNNNNNNIIIIIIIIINNNKHSLLIKRDEPCM